MFCKRKRTSNHARLLRFSQQNVRIPKSEADYENYQHASILSTLQLEFPNYPPMVPVVASSAPALPPPRPLSASSTLQPRPPP